MAEKIFQNAEIASLLGDYLYNKGFKVDITILEAQQYKLTVTYTQEELEALTDSEKEILRFFLPAMFGTNDNIGIN